ncbi:MAG TPA: hypothetical protein VGJ15_10395 [Pirellulales bacterium]|jgi:hypothetical protein
MLSNYRPAIRNLGWAIAGLFLCAGISDFVGHWNYGTWYWYWWQEPRTQLGPPYLIYPAAGAFVGLIVFWLGSCFYYRWRPKAAEFFPWHWWLAIIIFAICLHEWIGMIPEARE